jgi:hypothetical protein
MQDFNYTVLQFKLSREASDAVNSVGWTDSMKQFPEVQIQLEVSFSGGSKGFSSWMSEYYVAVCDIDANDLEGVFHVGNMGPEEKINRRSKMHSVSVGDVVRCNRTGTFHMVDGCGFTQLLSFTHPAFRAVA